MERKTALTFTRRELFKIAAITALPFAAKLIKADNALARILIEENEPLVDSPDPEIDRIETSSRGTRPSSSPAQLQLNDFLINIEPSWQKVAELTENNNLLGNFRHFKQTDIKQAIEVYFPMYYAAQEDYHVPWEILFVVHAYETNFSTEKAPERSGFLGAMQRSGRYYPDLLVNELSQNRAYLSALPQRYTQDQGFRTNDWQEILFAAWKMRQDADQIKQISPWLSDEDSILKAQYRYCAAWTAVDRINRYNRLRVLTAE